jgi:hypothetical protein
VVGLFGLVWFGLVWFGLVWFGLVWDWFGLVWFGFVRVKEAKESGVFLITNGY